jgi:hypothetical protein
VLRLLRDGDTLKITRLDSLGRSVLHLVTLGAELRERGVGLHVIEQGIETSTAEGRAMFGMLSVLAELQRELIVASTPSALASGQPCSPQAAQPPRNAESRAAAPQCARLGTRAFVSHFAPGDTDPSTGPIAPVGCGLLLLVSNGSVASSLDGAVGGWATAGLRAGDGLSDTSHTVAPSRATGHGAVANGQGASRRSGAPPA